ncbi:hypothetical protein [Asaccharospora irregularis]|uniref:hypothetical protein n=1 Tax=Asaccharospora irregularis TaxID=29359 RepID=UPI0013563FBB|nr:hypothetical protein [Asaccharospora irregularis]
MKLKNAQNILFKIMASSKYPNSIARSYAERVVRKLSTQFANSGDKDLAKLIT